MLLCCPADPDGGDRAEDRQSRCHRQGWAVAAGHGGRAGEAAVGVEDRRDDRDAEDRAELLQGVEGSRRLAEQGGDTVFSPTVVTQGRAIEIPVPAMMNGA